MESRFILKVIVGGLVLIAAVGVAILVVGSAPESELLDAPIVEKMRQGVESGEETFDHAGYDQLLREHVRIETSSVDYARLKEHEDELEAYLQSIAEADIEELGADEQLAFLLNAYNAYTLDLILEHYPEIESIRDISAPFTTKRHGVASHTLSLDNIEHNLIRPFFKDPRIHFAVNCAARDCPPLRPRAYTGSKIDEQLEEVTADVLSSRRFVRIEDGLLFLTKIMDWYGDDFVNPEFDGHVESPGEYVARHTRDEGVRSFIERHDGEPPISFLDYDWSLNDTRGE